MALKRLVALWVYLWESVKIDWKILSNDPFLLNAHPIFNKKASVNC